jgi:hypothetical protein
VRKLLIGVFILIVAVAAGLLIASLLLKQECPDCAGTARHLAAYPDQCIEGPAILDCPRCGDLGRVSLFNGYVGKAPDPFVAALMRHSNRNSWSFNSVAEELGKRMRESPLKTANGEAWTPGRAMFGRARFVRDEGKVFVLMMCQVSNWSHGDSGLQVCLFDAEGKLLDLLRVTAYRGASNPAGVFTIPFESGKPCARIHLLNWRNRATELVEIDHAEKQWKQEPPEPDEKLMQFEWKVFLRNGKLQITDAAGKSLAE